MDCSINDVQVDALGIKVSHKKNLVTVRPIPRTCNVKNNRVLSHRSIDFSGGDMDELLNQFSVPMRNHNRRVAICSSVIAEYAKELSSGLLLSAGMELELIAHVGGTCHDVGKLLLPAIDADVVDYLKHPVMGARLLEKYKDILFDNEEQARLVIEIVRCHHEQPDGGGFPYGLRARDIPLAAGICAAANYLDHRAYTGNMFIGKDKYILSDIQTQAGILFPESIMIFLEKAWKQLIEHYEKWTQFL